MRTVTGRPSPTWPGSQRNASPRTNPTTTPPMLPDSARPTFAWAPPDNDKVLRSRTRVLTRRPRRTSVQRMDDRYRAISLVEHAVTYRSQAQAGKSATTAGTYDRQRRVSSSVQERLARLLVDQPLGYRDVWKVL